MVLVVGVGLGLLALASALSGGEVPRRASRRSSVVGSASRPSRASMAPPFGASATPGGLLNVRACGPKALSVGADPRSHLAETQTYYALQIHNRSRRACDLPSVGTVESLGSGSFNLAMFGTAVVNPDETALLRVGVVSSCGASYSPPTRHVILTDLILGFRSKIAPPLDIVQCAGGHDLLAFWDMLTP